MPSGLWVYLRYEDPGFKTLPFSVEEKGAIETRLASNCLRCAYVVLEIELRASLVFYKDDKVQIQGPVHTRQTFHPEAKPQPQRGLLRITEFTPIVLTTVIHGIARSSGPEEGGQVHLQLLTTLPLSSLKRQWEKEHQEVQKKAGCGAQLIILGSESRRITVSLWQIGLHSKYQVT